MGSFEIPFFIRRDWRRFHMRVCGFEQFEHVWNKRRAGADGLKRKVLFQPKHAPSVDGVGVAAGRYVASLDRQIAYQRHHWFDGLSGLPG